VTTLKLLKYAGMFFLACMLIYYGAQALSSIWYIFVIIAVVVGGAIVAYNVWKNRPKW